MLNKDFYHFISGLYMSLKNDDAALGWLADGNIKGLSNDIVERNEIRSDEDRPDYYDADDIDSAVVEHLDYTLGDLCQSWWRMLGDIPINDDDEIDEPFMGWPKGTNRFDIQHWFDEVNPGGIKDLMASD